MLIRNKPIITIPIISDDGEQYNAHITGIYSNNEMATIDISYYVPNTEFENDTYAILDKLLIDRLSVILAGIKTDLPINLKYEMENCYV